MKASIEHNTPTSHIKLKRGSLSVDEINEMNRRIAETWAPEMDEEIERATRQYWLTRFATLMEEKAMCAAQRAQLMRELKRAAAEKLRSDAPGVDAEAARIRTELTDLEQHKLIATAELRAIRAQLRQA